MNEIVIRQATIKDLNEILRFNLELFKKERREYDKLLDVSWTYGVEGKKYFRGRIKKKDGFVVVAESGGRVIGYLCGGLNKMESYRIQKKHAELENMFVEKKFRGKGIGGKLTESFFTWCKENKVERVSVSASFDNKEAVAFYERMGFKGYSIMLEKKL